MFGCVSRASARASRRNLSVTIGSSTTLARKSLTATKRPSCKSVARHTSAMPPEAMVLSRRYLLPMRSSECRAAAITGSKRYF